MKFCQKGNVEIMETEMVAGAADRPDCQDLLMGQSGGAAVRSLNHSLTCSNLSSWWFERATAGGEP